MVRSSRSTRRAFLTAGGPAAGSAALAGCSALLGGEGAGDETPGTPSPTSAATGSPDGPVQTPTATAGRPSVTALSVADASAEYAVLGSADAPETATL